MSRKPSISKGGSGPASISNDDMCPVCKTIRYLNKDMEFLINPDCYHPMCSNCVNRLFNDGPNQCPYAGCHQTLRRNKFRSAFFGDLAVEREVDIRRRVAAVFNKVEDDFETLRDYNDYLQIVEDLTFDLVSGDDKTKAKAEAVLKDYERQNKAEIERNRKAGREAEEGARRRLAAEREAARQRRLDAAREAEEERLEKARSNEEALDQLARGDGTAARVQLKRRGGHRTTTQAPDTEEVTGAAGRLSIRGLKEKKKAAPESTGPYDPFAGYDYRPDRYKLRDTFANDWLNGFARDPKHATGGYDVREYYARAMFDAFSGLGVFIDDEKETGGLDMSAAEVAEFGAGMAAEQSGPVVAPSVKMEVDDVFA
ncbi:CDK-activating kinase assembly factor [Coniochaeta hoffmannii]|uniref:RNA polymerase II transcription factor B subunit 3 n=1 Tax=Coniochaeta hoffmannii TaxID=91930 RepID=A0AA38VKX4_9PEZI|nr:CDK-activating kinase assembly factor [Coniochaeta hoffmannii]